MAGHPPFILVPSPGRTGAHHHQQSNLHATTLSHPPTPALSGRMQVTTPSAHATLTKPLPHDIHHWIASPTSTNSWRNFSPPHPGHISHVSNISGLDRDFSQTRQLTSCFSAPSTPPPVAVSSEYMPMRPTSLALKTEAANSASSNVPPTDSYAPFPPDQTHLNW